MKFGEMWDKIKSMGFGKEDIEKLLTKLVETAVRSAVDQAFKSARNNDV